MTAVNGAAMIESKSGDGLLDATALAGMTLANRMVLAPMTRSRADRLGVPSSLAIRYYAQRAAASGGAGLLITEGSQPSFVGQGYVRTPGIHTSEQVQRWREITSAVHAQGSRIFLQIMHVGRISSHYNRLTDEPPIAPSAILAEGLIHTDAAGMQPHDMPRALPLGEIAAVIEEHALAVRNALLAGFDGVELHAMGAYLPAQFLSASANRRSDGYGGPPTRRIRFVVELLEAMAAAAGGAHRIGLRISPGFAMLGIADDDPALLYATLIDAIAPIELAYLHILEMQRLAARDGVASERQGTDCVPELKRRFGGPVIAAGNFDAATACTALAAGRADLVALAAPSSPIRRSRTYSRRAGRFCPAIPPSIIRPAPKDI